MTTLARPIIFLTFANDRDDRARYLRNLAEEARLVHRGGSFKSQPAELRCTALPDSRIAWRGFRVAMMIA